MRAILKQLILLLLFTSSFSLYANNTIFVVGAGNADSFAGPSGDGRATFRYSTNTNNLVFYKPTGPGIVKTNVKLYWSELDTASGGIQGLYIATGLVLPVTNPFSLSLKW